MMQKRLLHIALLCLASMMPQACRLSFNSVVLAPDEQTFSVTLFQNESPIVVANLAQDFTIALQDRFQQQSRLTLRESNADLNFSGAITGYVVAPVNVTAQDQAAQNRLTITVLVRYDNLKYPEKNWEKSFPAQAFFSAGQDISTVEADLHQQIARQLSQDIVNATFANW